MTRTLRNDRRVRLDDNRPTRTRRPAFLQRLAEMNAMRVTPLLTTLALCTWLAAPAGAQSIPEVKLPPSPPGQTAIQVGGTWVKNDDGQRYDGGKWIVVDYSRPMLKGRTNIFGSGADYGKAVMSGSAVWRAGANATTTLTTQVPLLIGGKRLEPGIYNILVDLKPAAWTLIISTQERQPTFDPNDKVRLSGATNYDPKFDVARAAMQVDSVDYRLESFTITFLTVSDRMFMLAMAWDNVAATVPIEIAR
jgi:hypothetical protein